MHSRWIPLLVACATLAGAASANADSHHEPSAAFKVTPLTAELSMLQGRGGNIAVLRGPDGLLVVDADFADMAPALEHTLQGIDPRPVRYLVNTHWHGDHTGGNAALGALTRIAHENARQRLSTPQPRPGGSTAQPLPADGLPQVTFDEGLRVHWGDEVVRVRHLPGGHTDGDAVVHFSRAGVLHTGDLFFSGRFPFVDTSSGGDLHGYTVNVARLLERLGDDTRIIPGHGPLSSPDDLRRFHRMLVETQAWAAERRAEGLGVEQAIERGLPDTWQDWGAGFVNEERWIRTLYAGAP